MAPPISLQGDFLNKHWPNKINQVKEDLNSPSLTRGTGEKRLLVWSSVDE